MPRAAVLVAVLLALGGCASSGTHVVGDGDQTRVVIAASADGGSDAALQTELTIVAGSCLGTGEGETETLLLWPAGTDVSYDDGLEVEVPDGPTLRVGDTMDLGGGMVFEPTSADEEPPPIAGLPKACGRMPRFEIAP